MDLVDSKANLVFIVSPKSGKVISTVKILSKKWRGG